MQMTTHLCGRTRARGRPWTHAAAVARNSQVYANYAGTARYCMILRKVAAKITQHHAQIVREGMCVNVHGCNQYATSSMLHHDRYHYLYSTSYIGY